MSSLQMPPQAEIKLGEVWRLRRPLHKTSMTNQVTWKLSI